MLLLYNIQRDNPWMPLSSVFSRFLKIILPIFSATPSAFQLPSRDFSFQQGADRLLALTRRLIASIPPSAEKAGGHRWLDCKT